MQNRILKKNGNYKTGALYRSIGYKVASNGYSSKIVINASHGIFIENGTKAHIIKPKRCKALKFTSGGKVIYAKKVRHPGTKANPFLEPALDKNIPEFMKGLERLSIGDY